MHEYYSAYYNGKCDSSKVFVGRMTKRFERKRKGVDRLFCYIGIDVDISKLQNVIRSRKTFYLSLNVINPTSSVTSQWNTNIKNSLANREPFQVQTQ